ncbi:MAG: helix-turn-helix transcriptional regulator [Nitrospira sp.]|nr:helix-turn-helix transcriptional regulator [Nitrospira sp.]
MARRSKLFARFGERMRDLRKERGFSQESFAAHCGLDRTYVGGIERGERNLALKNIGIIAKALGLTMSQLLEGVDTEREDS